MTLVGGPWRFPAKLKITSTLLLRQLGPYASLKDDQAAHVVPAGMRSLDLSNMKIFLHQRSLVPSQP